MSKTTEAQKFLNQIFGQNPQKSQSTSQNPNNHATYTGSDYRNTTNIYSPPRLEKQSPPKKTSSHLETTMPYTANPQNSPQMTTQHKSPVKMEPSPQVKESVPTTDSVYSMEPKYADIHSMKRPCATGLPNQPQKLNKIMSEDQLEGLFQNIEACLWESQFVEDDFAKFVVDSKKMRRTNPPMGVVKCEEIVEEYPSDEFVRCEECGHVCKSNDDLTEHQMSYH